MAGLEQAVFDHSGGRPDQGQGVRVIATLLAGKIEHAHHAAGRIDDRCRCAGQETIAFEKMFTRMHDHRRCIGQRSADAIRAAPLFMPDRTRAQRDAFGPVDKAGITQGVQQHALAVSEDHHAIAVARLVEQVFHHRPGM